MALEDTRPVLVVLALGRRVLIGLGLALVGLVARGRILLLRLEIDDVASVGRLPVVGARLRVQGRRLALIV
jgi:hypothetical protein